jgi:hypothetical protein
MSNDLRITQLRLKLIEGKLTLHERQILSEVAPLLLLANWVRSEAHAWLDDQVQAAGKGKTVDKATLDQVDKEVAASLGDADKEMGSTITAYIMSLVATGSPVAAALQVGRSVAQEYTIKSAAAAKPADKPGATPGAATDTVTAAAPTAPPAPGTSQAATTLKPGEFDPEELAKLVATIEPVADKWEQTVKTTQPAPGTVPPKVV